MRAPSLEKLLFYYYIVNTNDLELFHILELMGMLKTYPEKVLLAFMQMRNSKNGMMDFVSTMEKGTFDIRCEELAALKTDIYGSSLNSGKRDSKLFIDAKLTFEAEMVQTYEKYKSDDLEALFRGAAHMNYPQKMLDIGRDINYVVFTYTFNVPSYTDKEVENLRQLYLKHPVKVIKTLYALRNLNLPYTDLGSFLRAGFSRAAKYIDHITSMEEVNYNMFPVFYVRSHGIYESYLSRTEPNTGGRK